MTWHNIMAYAHQGIELRPLAGLPAPQHAPTVADASFKGSNEPHPILLTRKGMDALVHVERILDDANNALAAQSKPASPAAPGTFGAIEGGSSESTLTAARDQPSASLPRGD
jgi:penicillin-binding protein 1A